SLQEDTVLNFHNSCRNKFWRNIRQKTGLPSSRPQILDCIEKGFYPIGLFISRKVCFKTLTTANSIQFNQDRSPVYTGMDFRLENIRVSLVLYTHVVGAKI